MIPLPAISNRYKLRRLIQDRSTLLDMFVGINSIVASAVTRRHEVMKRLQSRGA
jgi:hypothetical protein